MKSNQNYLIQSNYFTKSILKDITEIQKDIIYYIQTVINFRDNNPPEFVVFNYNDFLKYKKVSRNNTYSPNEIIDFCEKLKEINGVFFNKQNNKIISFNLIDHLEIRPEESEQFEIYLTKIGKVFFYEKFATEYAKESKIQYTQIERNIIDLKGDKRKKFFELLSQFKETGMYRVSLKELRDLLGFNSYEQDVNKAHAKGETILDNIGQLQLYFQDETPNDWKVVEILKRWADFKRFFLHPTIEELNKNSNLDISNIRYEVAKTGTKITGLTFRFQRRFVKEELSPDMKVALTHFLSLGLTETQILFLFQRIGHTVMYDRQNKAMTFNYNYDDSNSPYYRRKIWFDNETRAEIKNVGGFLYEKVFPELKQKN